VRLAIKTRRATVPRGAAASPNGGNGAGADGAGAFMSIGAPLSVDGIAVEDEFLAPAQVRALLGCAETRRGRGDFRAAQIGSDRNTQRREEIRGDFTCWMGLPLWPAEQALMDELERLRLDLNREAMLGLFELELHYAWYPPGAGYSRHVDQPQGRAQRKVSMVLYLNEGWAPGAGGELRIFGTAGGPRDIQPLAGRMVCFLSAGREHAVLPTQRDRLSVSGWFRSRE
jgi:SM-20-related protein